MLLYSDLTNNCGRILYVGMLTVNEVQQFATSLIAAVTYVPYGITQCYLPPARGDIPAFASARTSWYSISDSGGCKAELT